MTAIYTDTSSAILLQKAGLLETLCHHGHVVFTQTVYDELMAADTPDTRVFKRLVDQKHVSLLEDRHLDISGTHARIQNLDPGEKQTLYHYLFNSNGFILTDDGKAAKVCKRYGFHFINALLVPKLFWYAGIIPAEVCNTQTAYLIAHGRYSETVIRIADQLDQNDLARFIKGVQPHP